MIDELNLPVSVAPESKPRRVSLAEYDRWVNDNLRTLSQAQKLRRLVARASRRPALPRFLLG